jgi:hypothetical protein
MGFFGYMLPKIITFGLIIAFGLTVIIAATSAKVSVGSAVSDKTTSEEDKENYKNAKGNLEWAIAIGWTLVAIAIVLLIVAAVLFFFGGEIAAGVLGVGAEGAEAMEGAEELYETLKEIKSVGDKAKGLYDDVKSATKRLDDWTIREQRGFLDFDGLFGGVIMKLALLGVMGIFFALGILCAMAANQISQTEDKDGSTGAIIGATFGIIPFSLFLIWWVVDVIIHYKVYGPNVEKGKKEQEEAVEEFKAEGEEIKHEHHVEKVERHEKRVEATEEKSRPTTHVKPHSSSTHVKPHSSSTHVKPHEHEESTLDSLKEGGGSLVEFIKSNTTDDQRKDFTHKVSGHVTNHIGDVFNKDTGKAAGDIFGKVAGSLLHDN